jgi:hypothetical protein
LPRRSFNDVHLGDVAGSVIALVTYAPAIVIPLVYCVWPGIKDRKLASALAVVGLPLYLAAARVMVNTTMTPLTPSVAFIVAFLSWLAVVRLPFVLRLSALVLLVLGSVHSWLPNEVWNDPDWKAALLNFVPQSVGNLELRPGV